MKENKLILFGYSGHAFVVSDSAVKAGYRLIGYFDKEKKHTGLPYLGDESLNIDPETFSLGSAIASIGSNEIREKLHTIFRKNQLEIATIIDPSSIIAEDVQIGRGTFIAPGSILNAKTTFGKGVIVNTGGIVEHECIIGDFTHIAPGAILCGNVVVGKRSFVGAGSIIKEGIRIGNNVIIGAGSIVLRDVPDNSTCVGNPAKIIKENV